MLTKTNRVELGLGLDISDKVRLVRMQKRKQWQVADFAEASIPDHIMGTGMVAHTSELGQIISSLVKRMQVQGKNAIASLPGHHVYFRTIILPQMPKGNLRKAAIFAVSSSLPIPLDEAAVSMCPSKDFTDPEGNKTEVFFTATRRQQVVSLKVACQEAGLHLAAVEFEPLAVQRLLKLNKPDLEAYLYLNMRRSSFCVFKDEVLQFQRYFDLDITEEKLHTYVSAVGGGESDQPELMAEETVDARLLAADILDEVRRGIEYYHIQNPDSVLQEIMLCGGLASVIDLDLVLSADLNLKVNSVNLEKHIGFGWSDESPKSFDLQSEYMVALGLAIREVV